MPTRPYPRDLDRALSGEPTTTAEIADLAVTTAKLAADAVDGTKVADGAIDTEHLAANAVETAKIADGQVTFAKQATFVSAEQTGTGSAQNVPHGGSTTPAAVLVAPTELPANLAAGMDIAEGSHDATNVVVTVTSGIKFKVIAFF